MQLIWLLLLLFLIPLKRQDKPVSHQMPERLFTKMGEIVKSHGEKTIADFLYDANIIYVYEHSLGDMLPDFYLPEYRSYIEYWGLAHASGIKGAIYRKSMSMKKQKYRLRQLNLISIYPEDLGNLKRSLLAELPL